MTNATKTESNTSSLGSSLRINPTLKIRVQETIVWEWDTEKYASVGEARASAEFHEDFYVVPDRAYQDHDNHHVEILEISEEVCND